MSWRLGNTEGSSLFQVEQQLVDSSISKMSSLGDGGLHDVLNGLWNRRDWLEIKEDFHIGMVSQVCYNFKDPLSGRHFILLGTSLSNTSMLFTNMLFY